MNPTSTANSHETEIVSEFTRRCQRLGVAVLCVDVNGRPQSGDPSENPGGVVSRAIIGSPQLRCRLKQIVAHWQEQSEPRCVEIWSGCWLLPVRRSERRRCVGYRVGVLLGPELRSTDQFRHACDFARLDYVTASRRVADLPPVGGREADRLCQMLNWASTDIDDSDRTTNEIDTLTSHLGETYEELSLVYKMTANAMVSQQPGEFIADAGAELHQVLGMRWTAIQLIDDEEAMRDVSGRLFISGAPGVPDAVVGELGHRLTETCTGNDAIVVADTSQNELSIMADVAEQMLIVPIQVSDRVVGVLFAADKRGSREVSSVDSKLATAAAQNMGIFLENVMLYEDAQDLFMGTLHALIASIDAKDTYTCGHSERVAWLSRELAQAAGLDEETVQRVYLSALVHDVGKIGVPESVLCKPGRLTDEEFVMIKAHPEIGARIIKDIRQMRDLIPGVLHHHERYDGRGYPHNLAGEDIPLFGRLICLADSFDAMSSNRTYRSALSHAKVLDEIRDCAGSQFDPAMAKVFVELNFDGFFEMLDEHQNRQSKDQETAATGTD